MKSLTTNHLVSSYNVNIINNETEEELFGKLGSVIKLLPGLAESLLRQCGEPDVVLRRIIKTDEGWKVDEGLTISAYYPGNSRQTMFVAVEEHTQDTKADPVDYYQLPYCEVVPRMRIIMSSRDGTDERYFVAQVNNEQIRGWFNESQITRLSEEALDLLDESEQYRNETQRNENGGRVEPQPKRTDN